MQSLMQSEG